MKILFSVGVALSLASISNAQTDEYEPPKWSGEGAFGAGLTTGNTDTVDVSLGFKLDRHFPKWKVGTYGGYEFGQTDGESTRDRWYIGGQVDRSFTDSIFGFVSASFETDQFSGFENRVFIGSGLGYNVFDRERLRWQIDLSSGYRIDKLADFTVFGPPEMVIAGTTERNFAVRATSTFGYDFNDNVGFTNETTVVWTDLSTQTINIAALNARLTDAITARISAEIRSDTNPPIGFVNTDTATRVSIVYGF